ncbi:MAG: hypothetical protein NVSMB62_23130 [Acidobacteriaceae bacterium]
MEIFRHGDGNAQPERVAVGAVGATDDDVTGYGAFGHADDGAAGAAEGEAGGGVAYGDVREYGAGRSVRGSRRAAQEGCAQKLDLAAGHGRWRTQAGELRAVRLRGVEQSTHSQSA